MRNERAKVSVSFASPRKRGKTNPRNHPSFLSAREGKKKEGFRKKKAKSREGPDSDAKTMRAKESSRTGRVQSTTNDWTFLDPFFAAGAMFDYYLCMYVRADARVLFYEA